MGLCDGGGKGRGDGEGGWPKQVQTAIAGLHQASPPGGPWSSVGLEIVISGNSLAIEWLI